MVLTVACGDDEGNDSVGDGDGDGDASGTDGSEGGSEGDGDGEPTGDGDGEPTGDGDGEPTGDGDGEPGNPACFDIEEQGPCDDDPDCQSVVGQPLQENGPDSPCLQPSEFLGCIPMTGCGDAETWFCLGGNGKPHLLPDTCGPENGEVCDPPADPVEACP